MSEPTSPLQIRDYRLFWLSRFCTIVATNGMIVVLAWQVYDVARSDYGMTPAAAAFRLGLLGLAQFLPLFILTPFAGLVADHFDRRHIGAIAIASDMTIALALALLTWSDTLSLPALFALSAAHGAVRSFVNPAMSAIAPNIVPPALLPRAVGMNSIAGQTGSVVGPASAGLLYAVSPSLPYFVSVALLVLGAVWVLLIRPFPRPPVSNDHPLRRIAEGFSFVRRERFLLGCITLDLFAVLLGGATALMPVFARDILHVGPEGLGQMRAAPAIGGALVAVWLSAKPLERNVGAKMLWAVVVYGAATAVFGLSRWYPLTLGALAIYGAADMVSVFIRSSLIQLNTPDDKRGRVSSISGMAISASNELGEMQSGVAASLLGATGAVVFGGVGAIVVTAAWAWLFPELRRARTFAPQYRQTKETIP